MRHPLMETPGQLPGEVSDAHPWSESRSNPQYLEHQFPEQSRGRTPEHAVPAAQSQSKKKMLFFLFF